MSEVTRILSAIEQGDPHAAAQLLPHVYEELRKLAAHKLAQEKPGQTLQATALVHEAYLRTLPAGRIEYKHRARAPSEGEINALAWRSGSVARKVRYARRATCVLHHVSYVRHVAARAGAGVGRSRAQ